MKRILVFASLLAATPLFAQGPPTVSPMIVGFDSRWQPFLAQPGARDFLQLTFHDNAMAPATRELLLRRRLRRVVRSGRLDRRTVASAG